MEDFSWLNCRISLQLSYCMHIRFCPHCGDDHLCLFNLDDNGAAHLRCARCYQVFTVPTDLC